MLGSTSEFSCRLKIIAFLCLISVLFLSSEEEALVAARRVARKIQKCGFTLQFVDYKIVNVLCVVYMPFGVRIDRLKDAYPKEIE